MTADPRTIYLADYQPYPFIIQSVALVFRLAPRTTRVLAEIRFSPNPERAVPAPGKGHDLFLHGENLALISCALDGQTITPLVTDLGLTINAADLPSAAFTLTTEVEIAPEGNTALEGLYMSNGLYCTQCEAEGFRKITYYPDRPDIMARFSVRIESDLPVLLSNGNPTGSGPGWATWDDPWPKPAYLFALVAGDLLAVRDKFTTASGRPVDLAIWVRKGDEDRCDYAMDSLIRSMRWDEDVYGREYDLDLFNIVAVDDFNMGAMENKGLNIFNAKLVLASPQTATDNDYNRIEGVIAHEYFHNWTGNRITCRDWFQLCRKEGLTVFRDQQFTGDMRSHAVKRIEDVMALRARQFREDGGPLAHPPRPDSFVEINNFYTATVYEKGAEVIGMLKLLVGDAGYKSSLDLYFDRHDGDAATIEDWLSVFIDATGRDLTQFKRWYTEAGTPRLGVEDAWEPAAQGGDYILTLTQTNPPTPGQPVKGPKVIPVSVGLLNPNGYEVRATQVLELTEPRQSFRFNGLATRPIASILRGFSAPVVLDHASSQAERAFLMAHDTDPFNRFEAGRALAKDVLGRMITEAAAPSPDFLDGMVRMAFDADLDPAFRAMALSLPSADDMAATLHNASQVPDPERIYTQTKALGLAVAQALGAGPLQSVLTASDSTAPFSPDAGEAGRRALRSAALSYLSKLDQGQAAARVFASADNMTESLSALGCLLNERKAETELAAFEARWRSDRLVMDKWFGIQVMLAAPQDLVATVNRLTARPDFDWKNPNRFRAVIGPMSGNHAGFHHASGSGYALLADWLIKLDPANPQTAARMSTAFETWPRYDAQRQALAKAALSRILATPGLSRDLSEMASRIAAG